MSVLDLDCADGVVVAVDLPDALLHAHLAALFGDAVAEGFPHHARAQPRIVEFLDQAGGVVGSGNGIPHRFAQRQIFDPLRRPVGADLVARNAPDLLGIGFEEVPEEPSAETVGYPLVEGGFILAGADLPLGVAEQNPRRLVGAHVEQRVERLQRVGEIFLAIENAAHPRALQEVVGQDFLPQRLDALHFGEEAVAADVVAIALVDLGAGDAADLATLLKDNRMMRPAVLVQLVGGGQPGRSAANDGDRRGRSAADGRAEGICSRLEIHHLPLVN